MVITFRRDWASIDMVAMMKADLLHHQETLIEDYITNKGRIIINNAIHRRDVCRGAKGEHLKKTK